MNRSRKHCKARSSATASILLLAQVVLSQPLAAQSPLAPPSGPDDHGELAEVVSFKKDIEPQLIYHCGYCHQSYDHQGYLTMETGSTWQALVNIPSFELPTMKRIEPGKPEQSYLWLKGTNQHLEAGGRGWVMPLSRGLDPQFAKQLYAWIKAGAHNN